MAVRSVIDILIQDRLDGDGSKELSDRQKVLAETLGVSQERMVTLGQAAGVVGGAFGVLAAGAVATWAAINEGADLVLVENRFGRLTESINVTSDAMLGRLREATRGTVSDMELMRGASQIISLGLASTGDETIRLTRLIGGLGWDMQQLTMTLANQSTARLDSLGLSMTEVTGRAEELRAAGVAADEAFKLAVIEAGEDKLKLLGETADESAGQIEQLTTILINLRDQGFVAAATGADDFIEALGGLAEVLGQTEGSTTLASDAFRAFLAPMTDGITAGTELIGVMDHVATTYGLVSKEMLSLITWWGLGNQMQDRSVEIARENIAQTRGVVRVTEDNTEAIEAQEQATLDALFARTDLTDAMADAHDQTEAASGASLRHAEHLRDERLAAEALAEANRETVAEAYRAASEALAEWKERQQEAAAASGDLFTEQVRLGENALIYADVAGRLKTNTDAQAEALYNAADAAGADATQLALLGIATGHFSEAQAEAALKSAALQVKINELGEAIASGMSIPEALAELENFSGSLESVTSDALTAEERILAVDAAISALDGKVAQVGIAITQTGNASTDIEGFTQQSGTMFAPAGRTLVGERGPEFVDMPHGATVHNAPKTAAMMSAGVGGGDRHFHLHVSGGDAAGAMQEFEFLEALAGA